MLTLTAGRPAEEVDTLPRLAELKLDDRFADRKALPAFNQLVGLQKLELYSCKELTVLPDLQQLPQLHTLSLSGCDSCALAVYV